MFLILERLKSWFKVCRKTFLLERGERRVEEQKKALTKTSLMAPTPHTPSYFCVRCIDIDTTVQDYNRQCLRKPLVEAKKAWNKKQLFLETYSAFAVFSLPIPVLSRIWDVDLLLIPPLLSFTTVEDVVARLLGQVLGGSESGSHLIDKSFSRFLAPASFPPESGSHHPLLSSFLPS